MCYLSKKNRQNISRFVTLFLAHGDVMVGFAIFHIVFVGRMTPGRVKRLERYKECG
jgi:hypothetical protein